jgi:6-phosphogluconolactonase
MAAESLIDHIVIPSQNVHAVPTELPLEAAAQRYGEEIARHVSETPPRFDLALLGLGEDGHVASLFPNSPALQATTVCIAVADAPKPPPERISVSLPVLNAARERLVLATGTGKAAALAAALRDPEPDCPASLLRRSGLTFVVDAAAAALLNDR